jgi:large subunit ribosomal protein L24
MAPRCGYSLDSCIGDGMSSRLPRKQRLRLYSSPLHARHKHLAAPLSPDLKQKYGFRSLPVRKGDRIKVLGGDFIGLEADVVEVDTMRYRIKVTGASVAKADGTEVPRSISPSKVMILKLKADKERDKIFERRSKVG